MSKTILMKLIILLILQWPSFVFAQQQSDPAYLQKAIQVILQQRNSALDAQAQAQVQVSIQAEEIAKLKARIEELMKPSNTTKPEEKER